MKLFAELTPEFVANEWKRFTERTGATEANQVLLGKILSWCKRRMTTKTVQRFLRQTYGVRSRLPPHIYRCSTLFDLVLETRFPSFTEAEYDRLTLSHAGRLRDVVRQAGDALTDESLAEFLATGIDGRTKFRHKSKDPNNTKSGLIYVLVSSAWPFRSKLGGTHLAAKDRAIDWNRKTGNPDREVAVWWEFVSDWKKAEIELHDLFIEKKVPDTKEWFEVKPKAAIEAVIRIAPKFRPAAGSPS